MHLKVGWAKFYLKWKIAKVLKERGRESEKESKKD